MTSFRDARPLIPACLLAMAASAAQAQVFSLTSTDLDVAHPMAATFVFDQGGCHGGNESPQLAWNGAPAGTKGYALTVLDPDAPGGFPGFRHWIVVDIPESTASLPRGAGAAGGGKLPAGARQLANGFETNGWGGPCPPEGQTHRYFFELYALKTVPVVIPEKASTQDIIAAVQGAALAKTTFVASYKR